MWQNAEADENECSVLGQCVCVVGECQGGNGLSGVLFVSLAVDALTASSPTRAFLSPSLLSSWLHCQLGLSPPPQLRCSSGRASRVVKACSRLACPPRSVLMA
jgi:hypothetical protein